MVARRADTNAPRTGYVVAKTPAMVPSPASPPLTPASSIGSNASICLRAAKAILDLRQGGAGARRHHISLDS